MAKITIDDFAATLRGLMHSFVLRGPVHVAVIETGRDRHRIGYVTGLRRSDTELELVVQLDPDLVAAARQHFENEAAAQANDRE